MKTSYLNTAVGLFFAVAGSVPGAEAAGIKRFGRRTHHNGARHHAIVALPAPNTTTVATSYLLAPTAEPECALEIITLTTTVDVTTTVAPTLTLTLSTTSSSSAQQQVDATVTSVTSSTTTEPCDTSSSLTVTPFSTFTQTTVYPIDTSIAPITTAVPTLTTTEIVTNTLPPTTTVCETSAPTGTPAPRAVHCGVHGLPVGDFFLGRYVEERAGVPVSLEGCWAFCKTAWGATNGCHSYDYYLNELGAPRCDLYSSRVAFALDRVDNYQPNLWFDLECGNPTDPKWVHSHPHVPKRSVRGVKRA